MRQKLICKYLSRYYYQENFTHLQLSKKSSYQTFSSTKNHIDSHNPPTHQPIFSFNPQHNTIIERNTKTPKCFLCQGYGHIALDCPNCKSITINDGDLNFMQRSLVLFFWWHFDDGGLTNYLVKIVVVSGGFVGGENLLTKGFPHFPNKMTMLV
uniref:Zinc finger, CCHC-type n=1 Tax=Medicago truncatula TaxID=3880 RepID=Q2HT64_MEDTR|nr:Zinc finger, CCHC-type [Medicago truncatula]